MKKNRDLKSANKRLNDQLTEKKINKKMQHGLDLKVSSHNKLTELHVLKHGIQNKFDEAEKNYQNVLNIYKQNKNEKNKKAMLIAKRVYKLEKNKMTSEIGQINKLNKSSKGEIRMSTKPGIAIEVKNVGKMYTTKRMVFEALKDVDLTFKKGSFNVILGQSGSGKTTLLNMISGLDRATKGSVNIDGTNIQALTTSQLTQFRRHNIGFVFQSYNLLESLNVSDNIEVGRSLQTDKNKRKKIMDLLKDMEMETNAKKMTYELSGGQQQRVSIARALSKTPGILIGDEPTGALDQATSGKVFDLFQKISNELKTTVIIVTHNNDVARLAHQVIVVKDGRIEKVIQNKKPEKALSVFK